ncbi:MAG TPA: guanylate kinase [bacterium]|nr:guanylate kinase [bacterium]
MSSKTGRIFVVSAPSGAGKTTLLNRLLADFPDIARSVSCTTRPPRAGEKEGVDYYYVDEKTFRDMAQKDAFFEWEEVHSFFYGTPKPPLVDRRKKGLDTVLDIDTRGAMSVRRAFPDAVLIFLMPPSIEALEARLKGRQTEAPEALKKRLENARAEMAEQDKFDYVIINDDVDRAYSELKTIISGRRK